MYAYNPKGFVKGVVSVYNGGVYGGNVNCMIIMNSPTS